METNELVDLIRSIKYAVQNAQLRTPEITIDKAELELKTVFSGGVSAAAKLGPVDLGGTYSDSEIQTLSPALVPAPPDVKLMSPASDRLTEAIVAVSNAARAAATSEPRFELSEATVEIKFGVDKTGKAQVFIGADIALSRSNTLTLTLSTK